MAGPFQIAGAFPPTPSYGPCGPFESSGGDLFCVAITNNVFTEYEFGAFKSSDGGASWSAVGGTKQLAADVSQSFGICAHSDFPTTPYLYCAYVDASGDMRVARFDCDIEDFDILSDAGDPKPVDVQVPILYIEHGADGILGLIVNYRYDTGESRVDIYSIFDDLGVFTGPVEVDGQTPGQTYQAVGIARGAAGRIHGFFATGVDQPGNIGEIYHTLVLEPGGGIGGSSDFVALSTYDAPSNAAVYGAGRIAIAHPGTGYVIPEDATGTQNVHVAIALDDALPAFDETSVYLGAIDSIVPYFNGSSFEVFWGPEAGDILRSVYDGATWSTPDSLGPGPFAFPSVRAITGAVGLIYSDDFSFDNLWYLDVPVLTPGGGSVLSGETIPSGEDFPKTHGITGGGHQNCGPVVIAPAEPGCNPNPGGPVDPQYRNTCNVGSGFSF